VELIFQQRDVMWPWYLISFSQGFNLISRLMMIMPHATMNDNGVQVANIPYLVLTVIAMILSGFLLWYSELPDVRMVVLREPSEA
jgi:Ni,Fe-hydrogenase I cytochrome b subunit